MFVMLRVLPGAELKMYHKVVSNIFRMVTYCLLCLHQLEPVKVADVCSLKITNGLI